jgi:hypothetical protein
MRSEAHIVTVENGHVMSTDCWCEPTAIRWMTNKHGVRVLVVEHDDTGIGGLEHHDVMLAGRWKNRTLPAIGNFADAPINRCPEAPWITRVLEGVGGDPPLLPPHADPNERSI